MKNDKPLDFLQLYFSDSIIQDVLKITNKEINEDKVEEIDIWKLIVFQLYSGLVELPTLRDYWSTVDDPLINPGWISTLQFGRDHFYKVHRNLSFNRRSMITQFRKVSTDYYEPTQFYSIDEFMMPFTGEISFVLFCK